MPYTQNTRWKQRIEDANKYYDDWANLYKVDLLAQYWRGFQTRQAIPNNTPWTPYTLNMVYSTIAIKQAGTLFQSPEFLITPKPGKMDWNQEFAILTALKKQDTLNQVIKNRNANFVKNLKLCSLDSYLYGFGVLEIGYAADWRNPKKQDLVTAGYLDSTKDESDSKVKIDEEVPENERLYFKRIPAKRFRVSTSDDPFLNNCNWCGYYSYMLKTTVEKTKGIKLPPDYIANTFSQDYSTSIASLKDKENDPEIIRAISNGQVYKVWNIWDNRTKEKYLILDDCYETIWTETFERLPIPEVKWIENTEGWYPIPPAWHWLSAQDEINESRRQMQNYRRRFIRKFWVRKGAVEPTEQDKFASGKDGEVIEVKGDGNVSLGVIQNPEIGISIDAGLSAAMNDMNLISATSANARSESDRTTATESKIIDMRSQVRESAEQMDFTNFICDVGRESLNQIVERFSEGMYIKMTGDPGDYLAEYQSDKMIYSYITAQDLDDGWDFDIDLAVTNAVPARMQEEETKFLKFISIMTQFPQLALSPKLIRETAYRIGYRNEAIIKEMQQAAIMRMIAQASMGQQNGNGTGSPEAGSMQQNSSPSPMDETNRQMAAQVS